VDAGDDHLLSLVPVKIGHCALVRIVEVPATA